MSTKLGTILADFTTALSTDIAVGSTTATLSSATDDDGVALPSGRYFFTLDGSNSSKEHISCDLIGTALTNIKSLSRQGVETTGAVRKHRIGTSVSLTDHGHLKFINDLVSGTTQLNSLAPLGYDGAPSALAGNQLATVTYVLGVVNGGTVAFDKQVISGQTSGEALTINDIVYFKEADAKWYKVDADLTTTFDQLQMGVAQSTVAINTAVTIGISGPMTGFSGLTPGSKYYASNTAGAITTTPGTYSVFVGWALSATALLFDSVGKTLPSQKEKDALVGSQGVPSSTNKYVTNDNTSASSSDQTQTTQNSLIEVGEADATTKKNKLAQSFIPSKTKIRGVNLYKSADTGTFTGTVTVSIQADSSGSPSGSALATQTITNATWLGKSAGAFEVLFTSEYAGLVAGSLYWIVIETSTSDSSNHPNIGTNTAGGYASGSVKYKNTADSWVAVSTIDLYFKTLEGNVSQLVKTDSTGRVPNSQLNDPDGVVGTLAPTIVKTKFDTQLPFGSVASTTTTANGWLKSGTNVGIIGTGGLYAAFTGVFASDFLRTDAFAWNSSIASTVFGTAKITIDFWAAYVSSVGDSFLGIGTPTDNTYYSAYNSTTGDKIGFATSGSNLYTIITKNGVGNTSTQVYGVTLSNYNNFKIVMGQTSADFYVNGVLVSTMSGSNYATVGNQVGIGFGRSGNAGFVVTAPNVGIVMNP